MTKDKPPKVEYFRHEECIRAFVGVLGDRGVFVLPEGGSSWTYHPANSLMWDSAHQAAYRNSKSDRLDEKETRGLPRLPATPEVASIPWSANFALTKSELLRSRVLVQWVAGQAGGEAAVHYLLWEDSYESMFGDGVFRYLHEVFLSEAESRAYLDAPARAETRSQYHPRTLRLTLRERELVLSEFSPQTFDHAGADEVLTAMVRKLSEQPDDPVAPPSGKPKRQARKRKR